MSLTSDVGNSCERRGLTNLDAGSAGRVHIDTGVPLAMTGLKVLGEGRLEAGRRCMLVLP